jgi:hypothetical protein
MFAASRIQRQEPYGFGSGVGCPRRSRRSGRDLRWLHQAWRSQESGVRSQKLEIVYPQPIAIAPDHEREWQGSGVDVGIIRLNVETLTDTAINPYEDELFPIASRLNWQVRRFGHKARPNLRGWWVSGIDPLDNWERMEWGRFKPDADTPIIDREKGKPAKYLSPSGAGSSRVVLLDVPRHIWQKVSDRYNIPLTSEALELGFWQWVWKNQLPLILTEGEKKAGCLLTLGYCAIALPGIFSGYRKNPDHLIPELAHFANSDRQIYICFDHETKPQTVQNISIATTKLGKLLVRQGCEVKVITLPGPDKGVDDLVVAQGASAFHTLYSEAESLDYWQAQKLWALTYTPTIALNQKYLGSLPFPKSGLAAIKSPKGSGKTASLEPLIREATRRGQKTIVLTHRVQLGRALCERLGLDWIEDLKESETAGLFGFGLCVDSLHFQSRARFNPQDWRGAILIIDEAEQVLWHLLNSFTCYENRVKILDNLRELVQTIVSSGGLIIAQDADLSDLSIDYLRSLAEGETRNIPALQPWVVVNEWNSESDRQVIHYYDTPTPAPLLTKIDRLLSQGAVFVALDSQKAKGQYSSTNLEDHYRAKYPDLRILRIDSESVADPEHPAYGTVERLNELLPNYDLVLATPTIGTGVDINLRGHFVAVVGIFQGAIPDSEARQALARVREPVPRYVWARAFGPGKIGNGSCNYREIIHSKKKEVSYNIKLLLEQDFDLDSAHDPITLRTWAMMASRVNVSMWAYRRELREGLVREGHQIVVVTEDVPQILSGCLAIASLVQELCTMFPPEEVMADLRSDLRRGVLQVPGFDYLHREHCSVAIANSAIELAEIRESNKQQEALAVVNAADITPSQFEQLQNQHTKTADERHAERKHQLQQRYPIPITPELKIKDEDGWYPQIRLHYYLMYNPVAVKNRDTKEWEGHLARGEGKVALQDVKLLTAQVELLRGLGIPALLDPCREVRATDEDVERMALLCRRFAGDVKAVMNLNPTKLAPIQIVQELLRKLGLKLSQVGRDKLPNGRRAGIFVYQYVPDDDGRELIFALWGQGEQGSDRPPDINNN